MGADCDYMASRSGTPGSDFLCGLISGVFRNVRICGKGDGRAARPMRFVHRVGPLFSLRKFSAVESELLQGIQERNQCLLILRAQVAEAISYVFGFAGVTFDGAL